MDWRSTASHGNGVLLQREGQGAGGGRVKVGFIGKRHDWPGGQGFIKG